MRVNHWRTETTVCFLDPRAFQQLEGLATFYQLIHPCEAQVHVQYYMFLFTTRMYIFTEEVWCGPGLPTALLANPPSAFENTACTIQGRVDNNKITLFGCLCIGITLPDETNCENVNVRGNVEHAPTIHLHARPKLTVVYSESGEGGQAGGGVLTLFSIHGTWAGGAGKT